MTTIAEIYAQVPDVHCKGLCAQACGPIVMSDAEGASLQADGIALPDSVSHHIHGPLTCSHLTDCGKCRIYERRPMICRLFGAVEALECAHGCRPKEWLPEAESRHLLNRLSEIRP